MRLFCIALLLALAGCGRSGAPPDDADIIVIGAGIAGLSAALEASAHGARVLVIDANSVGGGHAVKAGGLALVGTPLQAARGYRDDVETAFADLMAWSEDADPDWVRRYLTASGPEVHDWLAGFGIRFAFILDTPQHSVPRFHFARGAALNVVLPLLQAALERREIDFLWNQEAVRLLARSGAVTGVRIRDLRLGTERDLRAPAVIVATGGAQGDLEQVKENWRADLPLPERLYVGGGAFATGSGYRLAREAGVGLVHMRRQTIFTNGIPDPRDASGRHGLLTLNPAAIWVDAQGRRFINEAGPSKDADTTILGMRPASHWLIFDRDGLQELRVRDAVWMNEDTRQREVLDNPALVSRADSLAELAQAAGLPAAALGATVARFNALLEQGTDSDFGRFGPASRDPFARPVVTPPFYAIQRFPLSRKSMGGIAVDRDTRALDEAGRVIAGLYAAGEVTGVAGINGSNGGGEGTFLGPSVYMGRIAGREAAAWLPAAAAPSPPPRAESSLGAEPETTAQELPGLLALERQGYWHFGEVHHTVLERQEDCATCHSADWPAAPATTRAQRQAQLASCMRCH